MRPSFRTARRLAFSLALLTGLATAASLYDGPRGALQAARVATAAPTPALAPVLALPVSAFFAEAPARVDAFGFPERAYTVEHLIAPSSGSLAAFFVAKGVTADAAGRLAVEADTVLGLSAFEPGLPVHVYRDGERLSHVVYEPGIRSYVVLRPGILPVVMEQARPAERFERVADGEVSGSLARSFERWGADTRLADSLRHIFAERFSTDALRRGDRVTVVFAEERIGEQVVESGEVLAVRIARGKRTHTAFRFTHDDGTVGYYDADGQSLVDLFLPSPVAGAVVTSSYSMNRFHPVLEEWRPHLGTDFAAPTGAPILALGDGAVLEAGFGGGNGNYVKLRHDATYTTGYLHMVRLAEGIRPGVRVAKGQVIGYVGMTGLATGPHTCLRFWRRGAQVDFLHERIPPAPPVAKAERSRFNAQRDGLVERMEGATLRDRLEIEPGLDLTAVLGAQPLAGPLV